MLFANRLKKLREQNNLLQRQMSAYLEIDTGLYSKLERGERRVKREQLTKLAELLHANTTELLELWLTDSILHVIEKEDHSIAIVSLKNAMQHINSKK